MDVEAIRQRLAEATPGPWARHGCDVHGGGAVLLRGRDGSAEIRAQADRDADFVAHAHSDIAALLDVVDRLTAAEQPAAPEPAAPTAPLSPGATVGPGG